MPGAWCAGLLAMAFGPSYTYVLLRLLYGPKWSSTEAPAALAYYCGYITLLALNGCTEAYVNAVADARSEHPLHPIMSCVTAAELHVCLPSESHLNLLVACVMLLSTFSLSLRV